MKTLYTLFIVLFGCILFGQEYRPMLQSDNVWSPSFFAYDFESGAMHYNDYNFRLTNNTMTHNGKEFIGLEFRNRHRIENDPQTAWSEWQDAEYFLYENISEKKVYIYYPENQTIHDPGEFLLYDFNLEIGDFMNFEGFIEGEFTESAQITDITFENIFDIDNVKTYHFSTLDDFQFKVYEGICSSHGINTTSFMWDVGWQLTDFGTELNTQELFKSKSEIYPNPFSDKIQIQNSEEIKELQLFDLQGKLISTNKNLEELNSKLSSLNNAVYFLKIQFKNNQSETIKLIKNK